MQDLRYEQVALRQKEMRKEARDARMAMSVRRKSASPEQGSMRTLRLGGRILTYRTA